VIGLFVRTYINHVCFLKTFRDQLSFVLVWTKEIMNFETGPEMSGDIFVVSTVG
jgi:hypothetical protein